MHRDIFWSQDLSDFLMFVLLFLVLPIKLATALVGRKIEASSVHGNSMWWTTCRWPLSQAEYKGSWRWVRERVRSMPSSMECLTLALRLEQEGWWHLSPWSPGRASLTTGEVCQLSVFRQRPCPGKRPLKTAFTSLLQHLHSLMGGCFEMLPYLSWWWKINLRPL